MIVVDASVLAPALADDGPDGDRARDRLRDEALTGRCCSRELRHTLTSYDAAHVALAEVLGIVLVTADARLSRAPGTTCEVDVVR